MLNESSQDVEELRQELNGIEELGGPVEAPVEQLEQRHQSVGLEHIVPVLPEGAEKTDDLDHGLQSDAEMPDLLLGADQDPLAYLDQARNELQFAHVV